MSREAAESRPRPAAEGGAGGAVRSPLARPAVSRLARLALGPLRRRPGLPRRLWLRLPVYGTFRVAVGDGAFTYRSSGEFLGRVLYWRGLAGYEQELLPSFTALARESRTFYDVGAYCALYSLVGCAANPALRCVAFEPVPELADWSEANLRLSGFAERVEVVRQPVGLLDGDEVAFYRTEDFLPATSSLDRSFAEAWGPVSELRLRSTTLDRAASARTRPVDLVKIDVEGAEHDVLRGARSVLLEDRPVVLCEILPHPASHLARVRTLTAELGYRLRDPRDLGREVAEPSATRNYLLIPDEKLPWVEGVLAASR